MQVAQRFGQGVDLVVQAVDGGERRVLGRGEVFGVAMQPVAEAALVDVEGGRLVALAFEEVRDGADPGAVLDLGHPHGHVVAREGGQVQPARIGLPAGGPGRDGLGRHGPRDAVALAQLAAQVEQHLAVVHGFHALGDDLAVEGPRQAEHAFEDGQVVGVVEHVAHEALVDLELVHGQALEVGQRGVAGAEVVQREGHAHVAAGHHDLGDAGQVAQSAGLQHLQLQVAVLHLGVGGQAGAQALHEIGLLQLARTQVDADRQVQAGGAPGVHLLQGGLHHPLADVERQRVVLDDGQEAAGRQQAAVRVLPADQRFGPDDLARAHVHLGLVVQHELVVEQGVADVLDALVVAAHAAVLLGIEDVAAVLAGQLGLVHGLVGLAQQLVGIDLFGLRVGGQAQAGRDLQRQLADGHGLGGGGQHAVDHGQGLFGVAEVLHHGDELIAPDARQRVALAQGVADARGQCHQQLVTGFVAVAVVHRLEAVEVEVEHGQPQPAPLGLGHGLFQAVGQQGAVGQASEGVVVGVELQLQLVLFEGGDVGEQREVLAHHALFVAHGADGLHLGVVLAVLAAVPQLALPVALVLQLLPHRHVEAALLAARFQEARVVAQGFLAAVAGDAAEGLVDVDDAAVFRGDHDAFAGVREHAGGQVQALFGLLAFDGQAGQAGDLLDQADVLGRGRAGRAVVDGEGAQHLAVRREDGLRPAGAHAGAVGQLAVALPQRVGLDVFDHHALGGVGRGAATAHAGPDGDAVHRRVVVRRQAGCGAQLQVLALVIEQQDAAQHGGVERLDAAHRGLQQGGQVVAIGQLLEDVAAELLEAFGLLAPAHVGEGADHAHRPAIGFALHDGAAAEHPQLLAAAVEHAVFAGEGRGVAAQVALQLGLHALQVVGMDLGDPGVGALAASAAVDTHRAQPAAR